jgi:hypothetical protein
MIDKIDGFTHTQKTLKETLRKKKQGFENNLYDLTTIACFELKQCLLLAR